MKTFETMILDQINKISTDGTIEAIVQKKVEAMVKDTLDDTLRSYSDYTKAIKEKLNASLIADLDKIDFPQYSNLIGNAVILRLGSVLNETAKETIFKKVDEILDLPPKEINLSELIEKYKEQIIEEKKEDCSCDYDPYESHELSLIIERDGAFTHIYLHSEKVKKARYSWDSTNEISKYSYDIRFGLHNGKVFTVSFGDQEEVEKRVFNRERSGLAQILLNLYCMGSSVILDEENDEYDLEYSIGDRD